MRLTPNDPVILSRADGEGSPNYSLGHLGAKIAVSAFARSFGALRQPQDDN